MDAALIENCADPSLASTIVEQFVAAAGSDDPLAVTVTSGGRLVLIPKPRSVDEAIEVVREHVGHAVVRVGITQLPAGVGTDGQSAVQAGIFDACQNLRAGTALFAKIARIVTKWYGHPTNTELLPQMLDDTIFAWKVGRFEGDSVFKAKDPGGPTFFRVEQANEKRNDNGSSNNELDNDPRGSAGGVGGVADAGMRIDLSRIGEAK